MATKQTKNNSFKEILVAKNEDCMDEAFATNDAEKRQKYREAIRQMGQLLLAIAEIG